MILSRVCYWFRLGSTEIMGMTESKIMLKSVLGRDICSLSIAFHEEVLYACRFYIL